MRNIENSIGKIFRHFKGDLYLIEGVCTHSETGEKMVLYRALYGDCGLYVRPFEMFLEEVPENKENPTGQKYRFEEYEVKSVK
ncbi:MAG: DUF1653 domain-containing protein [Clostridium sp.]